MQSGFVAAKKPLPEPVKRIRSVIKARDIKIRDLYPRLRHLLPQGDTEQIFRNKLTGRTAMDQISIDVLSKELGLKPTEQSVFEPRILYGKALGDLRILGGVAAGLGWEATDEDILAVPISLTGPNRVGWIVRGDSMLPFLQEGDVAIFEASIVPKLGIPNLIRTSETEYRVKMVRHDGEQYRLFSLNPVYGEEMATGSWMGYLVGYYRLIGSQEEMKHNPSGLKPETEFLQKV